MGTAICRVSLPSCTVTGEATLAASACTALLSKIAETVNSTPPAGAASLRVRVSIASSPSAALAALLRV